MGVARLKRLISIWFILLLVLLAACNTSRGLEPQDIPTLANFNEVATTLPLTQNAPPPPINGLVTDFSAIDAHLPDLSGWRYIVQLEFNGVFARTPRQATASAQAQVWFNQLASARRVQLTTSGELIGQTENNSYEAVRLGPDAFLVRGGSCLTNAPNAAQTAADLQAGQLVGGVRQAMPGGKRATINGIDVYAFTFAESDLILPSIRIGDGGSVKLSSGECGFRRPMTRWCAFI